MRTATLTGQLIRWQLLAMGAAWLVLAGWLTLAMMRLENGDLDRRMTYFAQILAETAAAEAARADLPRRLRAVQDVFVRGIIESLDNADRYEAVYQVFDGGGQLLYRSPGAPLSAMTLQRGVQQKALAGDSFRIVRIDSSDHRVTVVLAEPLRARRASVLPMLKIIGGGQCLIFLVCLGVVWWSARRALAPLRSLAARVGNRSAGDLTPIEGRSAFREIEPVIAAMNDLLHREAERLEKERGFLADAAHELRTPLAAIGAQAHLLLQASSVEARQRAARQLEEGLARVSHLLVQLLTIARVDADRSGPERSIQDVAEIVRTRVAEFAGKARARGIAVQVTAPDNQAFLINRAGFISVVDNLLDNAIRYTPSGGSVHATLRLESNGDLELAVRDSGPGVPESYRERVFERFFRIPGTQASGSGLGLAIVRRIVSAHGASIELANGLGGRGLGVIITIPSA